MDDYQTLPARQDHAHRRRDRRALELRDAQRGRHHRAAARLSMMGPGSHACPDARRGCGRALATCAGTQSVLTCAGMSVGYGTLSELVRGKRRAKSSPVGTKKYASRHRRQRRAERVSSSVVEGVLDHIADVAERMANGEVQLSQEVARQHARGRAHEGSTSRTCCATSPRCAARSCATARLAIRPRRAAGQALVRAPDGARPRDRRGGDRVRRATTYEQRDRTLALARPRDERGRSRARRSTTRASKPCVCSRRRCRWRTSARCSCATASSCARAPASAPTWTSARLPVRERGRSAGASRARLRRDRVAPVHAASLLRHEPIDTTRSMRCCACRCTCAGELIGVVYVGSQRTLEFEDDDIRLMTALARRVAQALSQSMETERAQQAVRARDDVLGHGVARPRQSARRDPDQRVVAARLRVTGDGRGREKGAAGDLSAALRACGA